MVVFWASPVYGIFCQPSLEGRRRAWRGTRPTWLASLDARVVSLLCEKDGDAILQIRGQGHINLGGRARGPFQKNNVTVCQAWNPSSEHERATSFFYSPSPIWTDDEKIHPMWKTAVRSLATPLPPRFTTPIPIDLAPAKKIISPPKHQHGPPPQKFASTVFFLAVAHEYDGELKKKHEDEKKILSVLISMGLHLTLLVFANLAWETKIKNRRACRRK